MDQKVRDDTGNAHIESPVAARAWVRRALWRMIIFFLGLIPVSGQIEFINSPWTFTIGTSKFLGYVLMINSLVTGFLELMAKSDQTKRQIRRWFRWSTFLLIVILVGLLVLPTL